VATHYKQPKRINAVSVSLLLIVLGGGWLGYNAWPIISLNGNVKNELGEALPRVYKANLLPEPTSSETVARIQEELLDKLKKLGVDDPKAEVVIDRTKEKVTVQAKYTSVLLLKGLDKTYELALNPKVETDAARVDW
jgi:hypothetical protein